ncbi:MAG TPA: hypothetical protein VL860_04765 [Planctomycetota bacterium]|nr:hypothetical protein [Planctomycetota bacterium]
MLFNLIFVMTLVLSLGVSLPADQVLNEDMPPTMFGLEQQGPDAWPFVAFNGRKRMDEDGLPAYRWKILIGPWVGWQGGEFRRDPVFIPDPLGLGPPIIDFDGNEDLPSETNVLPYIAMSLRPFRHYPIHEFNAEYTEARFKDRPSVGRGRMEGQHLMVWYRLRLIRTSWLEAGLEAGWGLFIAKARLLTDVDAFGQPIIEDLVKRINNPVMGISGRIPITSTFHFVYAGRGNPIDIGSRILRTSGGFDWQFSQYAGIQATYEYLWVEFYEDFLYVKATVHGPLITLTLSY